MNCIQFGGECNPQCQTYPCNTLRGYEKGRADKEAEIKPLLNAIKFTLEDYSTRLGDYAKVIDEKLKGAEE